MTPGEAEWLAASIQRARGHPVELISELHEAHGKATQSYCEEKGIKVPDFAEVQAAMAAMKGASSGGVPPPPNWNPHPYGGTVPEVARPG